MSSDTVVQQAPKPLDRPMAKFVPYYLVTLSNASKTQPTVRFIASKFDENSNYGKFIGFFSEFDQENITKNYQEIVKTTPGSLYKEMSFPWHRVLSIENLNYRHKQ